MWPRFQDAVTRLVKCVRQGIYQPFTGTRSKDSDRKSLDKHAQSKHHCYAGGSSREQDHPITSHYEQAWVSISDPKCHESFFLMRKQVVTDNETMILTLQAKRGGRVPIL
jgi:hypothetical protein